MFWSCCMPLSTPVTCSGRTWRCSHLAAFHPNPYVNNVNKLLSIVLSWKVVLRLRRWQKSAEWYVCSIWKISKMWRQRSSLAEWKGSYQLGLLSFTVQRLNLAIPYNSRGWPTGGYCRSSSMRPPVILLLSLITYVLINDNCKNYYFSL
jgi:hypothetical protein